MGPGRGGARPRVARTWDARALRCRWLDVGMPRCNSSGCFTTLSRLPLSAFNSELATRAAFFEDAAARGKLGRPTVMGPSPTCLRFT